MSDDDRTLRIQHHYPFPPALVFDAWTRPEHVDRWFGPDGFRTTTQRMDLRPGGEWVYEMEHPVHGRFPNRVRYVEVVVGERLVYDHDAGEGDEANAFRVTVGFHPDGRGGTRLTMEHRMPSAEAAARARGFQAEKLGQQTLARLEAAVAADAEADLVLERRLRAPRAAVWAAWTEAAQLARWWGPVGMAVSVLRFELRPGGLFHFSMTGAPGTPMAGTSYGRFCFDEIAPPERLQWVHGFADAEGKAGRHPLAPELPAEMLNTLRLEAEGADGTLLRLRSRPLRASPSERAAFAALRPSMEQGYGATLDQLAAALAEG